MAFEDRTSNLLFLLSFSPLVAGCPAGDDTSSGETTGTPMTTGSTGTPTTADSTGTPMTSEGTSTSTGPGTSATTETGLPPDTDGDTTGGLYCEDYPPMMVEGPINPVCVASADKYNECYYDGALSQQCLDYYQAACQYGLEYAIMTYGDMCGMAYIDLYSCINALTCEELQMPDVCAAEYMALTMECSA